MDICRDISHYDLVVPQLAKLSAVEKELAETQKKLGAEKQGESSAGDAPTLTPAVRHVNVRVIPPPP